MANTINCFHVKIENWKSKQDRRKLHGCSTRFMKDCEKTEILKISLKYPISRNTHIRSGKKGRHETNLALVLSCVVGVLTICHVPRLVVWLFGCLVVDVLYIYLVLRVILIVGELFIVENRIKCGRFSRLICRVLTSDLTSVLTSDLSSSQDFFS